MKNNILKNELEVVRNINKWIKNYVKLIYKIMELRELNKFQKNDFNIGFEIYLDAYWGGSGGSNEWCEENLGKKEYLYFKELIGDKLMDIDFKSWEEEGVIFKLIDDNIKV
jgi:hypothetical protein